MSVEDFLKTSGAKFPLIGGPMYPCSNPELVAAVSEAGGLGIVQPLSLTFVYGYEFRKGLKKIRSLTSKPIGLNALIEASSQKYLERQKYFVDVALEEGVKFFITSLGNPSWVVEKAKTYGALVYHDVTEKKWAEKAVNAGVHGLICVNNRAGGHTGSKSAEALYEELKIFNLPLICAGGVGTRDEYQAALKMGYSGVQIGTRLIATHECAASSDYKTAILNSSEQDIVLTEKLTGVPVSVINTEYIKKMGTEAGAIAKFLLSHPRAKHWMRAFYSIKSFLKLKKTIKKPNAYDSYYQAGKSVRGIDKIMSVKEIMNDFNSDLIKS